jgi:hypothetical protein
MESAGPTTTTTTTTTTMTTTTTSASGTAANDLSRIPMELGELSKMVCLLVDIPVYEARSVPDKPVKQSRTHIDSLHVLFHLYLEFKSSPHFSKFL